MFSQVCSTVSQRTSVAVMEPTPVEEIELVVAVLLRLASLPAHSVRDTVLTFPPAVRAYFAGRAQTFITEGQLQPCETCGAGVCASSLTAHHHWHENSNCNDNGVARSSVVALSACDLPHSIGFADHPKSDRYRCSPPAATSSTATNEETVTSTVPVCEYQDKVVEQHDHDHDHDHDHAHHDRPYPAPHHRSLGRVGTISHYHQPYIGGSPEAIHQMTRQHIWFAVWIASCQYMGVSIQIGMVVCVLVYGFSFIPWQLKVTSTGTGPVTHEIDYRFVFVPVMALAFTMWLWGLSNAYVSWGERAASRYAKWCVVMSVVSVPILLPLQLNAACQTLMYYRLDLMYWVAFHAGSLLVISLFKQRYIRLGLLELVRTEQSLVLSTPQPMVMTFSVRQHMAHYAVLLVSTVGLLVLAIVFLHQDSVVIKTILRLVVFQPLHAVYLLLNRNQAVHAAAFQNKSAQQSALNKMLAGELYFNLIGRNLISNLGDTRFELLALTVSGLADILLRATLYQQENVMRRLRGQPYMTPEERRQLAPIFGVMCVHATISEYINILIAAGIKLWYVRSMLFNFGFSQDGSAEQLAVVAVTVAASIFIQLLVDLVALFLQALQGIPIFQYWVNLNWPLLINHLLAVFHALFVAFMVFTNAPAFYAP